MSRTARRCEVALHNALDGKPPPAVDRFLEAYLEQRLCFSLLSSGRPSHHQAQQERKGSDDESRLKNIREAKASLESEARDEAEKARA